MLFYFSFRSELFKFTVCFFSLFLLLPLNILYSSSGMSVRKGERAHQQPEAAAREEKVRTAALLSIGSAGGVEGHKSTER
jgi:hypothetical protein